MLRTVILAALALVCVASAAEARPRHHRVNPGHSVIVDQNCNVLWPCEGVTTTARGRAIERAMPFGAAVKRYDSGQVIGGRPQGCPYPYCGCAASLHLFGRIIPRLNLAANWLRFPRAQPAPKMAAARSGHVFVLEQHISGDIWLVFDANSGGGKTRLHQRSIAGFTIVDPSGAV